MMIPDTIEGLLAQADAVDNLLTILSTHTTPGPISHVSVAPWTMGHLAFRNAEIQCIVCGISFPDHEGREMSLDGVYLRTPYTLVEISVEQGQETAYRLWDRDGRELIGDSRGWLYVVSGRSRG